MIVVTMRVSDSDSATPVELDWVDLLDSVNVEAWRSSQVHYVRRKRHLFFILRQFLLSTNVNLFLQSRAELICNTASAQIKSDLVTARRFTQCLKVHGSKVPLLLAARALQNVNSETEFTGHYEAFLVGEYELFLQ